MPSSALIEKIDLARLPRHVAVIMDGNGRWAQLNGHERSFGHFEGVKTVRRITEIAVELGIEQLTLYTFSTENWRRPEEEINVLMSLIVSAVESETPDLIKNNVKLTTIGDINRIPQKERARLLNCIADTANDTGLTLCLALSYSSQWEITQAAKQLATDAKNGIISPDDIDENRFKSYLTTAHMPDPDLLIRTAGDLRISNFLLWQIAYSELYFTPIYWPEFSKDDFCRAIIDYQSRERRFGKTSAQVANNDDKLNVSN